MRHLNVILLAGCVGLCLMPTNPLIAQTPRVANERFNELARSIVAEDQLPGLIVATMADGKLAAMGSAGIRKAGEDQSITLDDKIRIGSCTKAMTATLMAILVRDGALKWDSTVGEIFPEYQGKIHDDYLNVTLAQLLAHRGGVPANAPNWSLKAGDIVTARDKILMQSLAKAPAHPPNTKFLYSNVGYVLAGHMAEKVLGQSWEDAIRTRLFEPLQMTSAGFGPPNTRDETDQPWGHFARSRSANSNATFTPAQIDNPPALGPAGTVHCSVEDWAKFLGMHLKPESHPDLLSKDQVAFLHTPFKSDRPEERQYASGWVVGTDKSTQETGLGHSGSNTAWLATVRLSPQRGVGYIAVTNLGGDRAQKATDRAIRQLMAIGSTD